MLGRTSERNRMSTVHSFKEVKASKPSVKLAVIALVLEAEA